MRKEYNLKLIKDYVEGNDLEDYNIDELENDYEFMISVIKYTNDKNIYNLCSDSVKNNFEFVKFIINYFKDDIEFIDKISEQYLLKYKIDYLLDHPAKARRFMDIALNMMEINEKNIEHYAKYSLFAKMLYIKYACELQISIKEEKLESEFGLGFMIVRDDFDGDEKSLNYFAINFINDLLFNNDSFDLEREIHKQYNNFSEIEKQGINNFMINLLASYDTSLSDYTAFHLESLIPLKETLFEIKESWNDYLEKNEQKRYDLILERIHSYIIYNEPEYNLEEIETLCYIGTELGIEKQIKESLNLSDDEYNDFMFTKDFYLKSMNSIEQKHYHNIKNIMIDILSQKIVDDRVDNYTSNENKRSKILKIDFNNKTNVNY